MDADFSQLSPHQQAEAVGALKILSAVMGNPKTKAKAQAILKELNPNLPLPEHDLQTAVDAKIAKLTELVQGHIKSQTEQREDADFRSRWDGAMSKHGITEEGQKKVHELMTERKIADPEAGALLFNSLNPPQEQITSSPWASGTLFDPSPDTDLGEWFANPEKKRNEEINRIFSERR